MSTLKQRSPVACARLPRILRIACALAPFLMLASAAATATGGELSVENLDADSFLRIDLGKNIFPSCPAMPRPA